jgi:hypothetical protein
MDCRHCGKSVSIIRFLTDSQYCCEDHRWTHLEEVDQMGLALMMRQVCISEPHGLSAELPPAATFFSSGRVPAVDAGWRDSTESPCFRIGTRVIQPPVM